RKASLAHHIVAQPLHKSLLCSEIAIDRGYRDARFACHIGDRPGYRAVGHSSDQALHDKVARSFRVLLPELTPISFSLFHDMNHIKIIRIISSFSQQYSMFALFSQLSQAERSSYKASGSTPDWNCP